MLKDEKKNSETCKCNTSWHCEKNKENLTPTVGTGLLKILLYSFVRSNTDDGQEGVLPGWGQVKFFHKLTHQCLHTVGPCFMHWCAVMSELVWGCLSVVGLSPLLPVKGTKLEQEGAVPNLFPQSQGNKIFQIVWVLYDEVLRGPFTGSPISENNSTSVPHQFQHDEQQSFITQTEAFYNASVMKSASNKVLPTTFNCM